LVVGVNKVDRKDTRFLTTKRKIKKRKKQCFSLVRKVQFRFGSVLKNDVSLVNVDARLRRVFFKKIIIRSDNKKKNYFKEVEWLFT
jgi:translation elongation factor EF-G